MRGQGAADGLADMAAAGFADASFKKAAARPKVSPMV
jgi:hypothetical protein